MTAKPDSTFAKAYEEYVTHRTSSAPLYQRFGAAAICAAALGNRVYAEVGWGRVYPCLWVGFIGPSKMRKTTAVNAACDLLTEAASDIEYPQSFSPESFFRRLAKQPSGLMRWREMGSVLEAWKKDYMIGISANFTEFWDSPTQTVRELTPKNKSEPERFVIKQPAITIMAASKVQWLLQNILQRDIKGGFLGRWLFVVPDEAGARRPFIAGKRQEDGVVRETMVSHLRDLQEVSGQVDLSQVRAYLNKWVEDCERWLEKQGEDYDEAEFGQRAGTQVLKLAMAVQAGYGADSALVLSQPAVASAIGLWNIAFEHNLSLVRQLGNMGNSSEKLHRLDAIMQEHGGSVTRRELLRETGLTLRELSDLIKTKCDMNWIAKEVHGKKGGRPSIVFRIAREGEDEEEEEVGDD